MCKCLTAVNEHLAEKNTQVTSTIAIEGNTFKFKGVEISTHKIDTHKRGKPTRLTAAFCPFCGEKYETE